MIKNIYENLSCWLHYAINFELLSLSCTEKKDVGSRDRSSDDTAIQLLRASNVALRGYYMLEIEVSDIKQATSSGFHASKGLNYHAGVLFKVPISRVTNGNRTIKRICFFEESFDTFHFVPSEDNGCGTFSITLKKLPEFRAMQLMLKKLKLPNNALRTNDKTYDIYNALFSKPDVGDYKNWINTCEVAVMPSINNSAQLIANLALCPLMSIVCPVYNTKPEWLDACFNSVLNQTYSNWQLVIVDDASNMPESIECLKRWQAKNDARINIVFREINGHICEATNTGLALATGDYICFLDHDDMLAPQALIELANSINQNPGVQIIYSDEDLMSESGERITPHFKSDWNPELLLAHNYITHLCCYKSNVIKQLDGMREGLDGAQDYDLILRASRIVRPENIIHIPKILYHWRMVEGSTAMSSGAKSYATQAGLKALQDHMAHINPMANVNHSERENFYKVNWPVSNEIFSQAKVTVIIPTRDGLEVLKPCVEGLIHNTKYKNLEVIIVDNGSIKTETLNYFQQLSLYPFIEIIRDDSPFNYSALNNHAVQKASGELICLLNNDIEIIHDDWLSEMVSLAIRPEAGCVGAKLLYPDDTIQHAGVIMGLGGYAAHSHRGTGRHEAGYFCRAQVRQNLSAVTAACLLVRREVYMQVNGLDEQFKVAYNDVDFCLRVQAAGYQNIYTPYAELYHHESRTRGSDDTKVKQKRFDNEKSFLLERWSDVIKHDPFYNQNLTRAREDFSIGCI